MDLVHSADDPPHREVTLRPRQSLHIHLPAGGWHTAVSSDPQLAAVTAWCRAAAADGPARATVIALRAGTAEVTVTGERATLTVRVSVAPYPTGG